MPRLAFAYSWKHDLSGSERARADAPQCGCCNSGLPALALYDTDGKVWGRSCFLRACGAPVSRSKIAQLRKKATKVHAWPLTLRVSVTLRGDNSLAIQGAFGLVRVLPGGSLEVAQAQVEAEVAVWLGVLAAEFKRRASVVRQDGYTAPVAGPTPSLLYEGCTTGFRAFPQVVEALAFFG